MATRRLLGALVVTVLTLTACGSDATGSDTTSEPAGTGDAGGAIDASPDADALKLVVTTTILGDVVQRVVGDNAEVQVLLPPGQDPHGYAPSAQDAEALRQADLVIVNGYALEEALLDVIEAAEQDGVEVLRVAEEIEDPVETGEANAEGEHGDDEHAEDGHDHGPVDPHFWFDPLRMAEAVTVIAEHVAAVDPSGASADWSERGETVAAEMEELHAEVETILDAVPEECRRLVTNHDNLGYLADRYGFEIVGTVMPGTSTQAEPSARDFADLAALVRDTGVPAIFAENVESPSLAETLAQEVGRDVQIVTLYTDSLGEPGSGAETYAGLLTTDAERIADALADC